MPSLTSLRFMHRSDPKPVFYFPTFIDCLQIFSEVPGASLHVHLAPYVLMIQHQRESERPATVRHPLKNAFSADTMGVD
jgi:hypothetical protein